MKVADAQGTKRHYASKAMVRRYLELAREMGMDVAAFEVTPEGAIKVMEARAESSSPISDYDRYKHLL